jgi:hypothetical protein
MSTKPEEDQEDEIGDIEGFVEEEATDFKIDVNQDKKINLERRRKIEEKIELYRLRDECGFYDLEI